MNEDKRRTEPERREAALNAPETDVDLEAWEVPSREIRQMLSVRIEPRVVRELRRIAQSRGVAVSDLLREAAARLIEEERRQHVRLSLVQSGQAQPPKPSIQYRYWDGERGHGTSGPASYGTVEHAV